MAGTTDERRVDLGPGEARELAAAARDHGGDPKAKDHAANPAEDAEWEKAAPRADRDKPKTRASRTAPISDRTKARIRKLAREGMSRNGIAREVKVSSSTVSRVCAAARPPISFDRSETAAATEAKVQDLKARRAEITHMAVDEITRLFGLLTSPHEVIHWDKDGFMHRGEIERPTSGDVKNYATAIGILTDKHLALIRHDSDDRDLPAVDKWLAAMGVGVAAALS